MPTWRRSRVAVSNPAWQQGWKLLSNQREHRAPISTARRIPAEEALSHGNQPGRREPRYHLNAVLLVGDLARPTSLTHKSASSALVAKSVTETKITIFILTQVVSLADWVQLDLGKS